MNYMMLKRKYGKKFGQKNGFEAKVFFKNICFESCVTLDLDSTVIGVSGSQEGAEKGFNLGCRNKALYPSYVFTGFWLLFELC
jgi:hypothetical protein